MCTNEPKFRYSKSNFRFECEKNRRWTRINAETCQDFFFFCRRFKHYNHHSFIKVKRLLRNAIITINRIKKNPKLRSAKLAILGWLKFWNLISFLLTSISKNVEIWQHMPKLRFSNEPVLLMCWRSSFILSERNKRTYSHYFCNYF